MNFDFSEDQKLLRTQTYKFLAARCPPAVVREVLDSPALGYDKVLWNTLAEQGWTSTGIPEEFQGSGLGKLELCVLAEELGRFLAPVPFSSTMYLFSEALLLAGSGSQKAQWLPKVAAGQVIGCMAVSEGPGHLRDHEIRCTVTDGRLTGTKLPVVDGTIGDAAIVLAVENGRPGLYLARLDASTTQTFLDSIDPTRGIAKIVFEGTQVEPLGEPGNGRELLQSVLDRAAVYVAFEQLGGAERCLEMAKDYALNRYAFGRQIGSFQAIKHKLADMYIKIELARANAYYGAWALEANAAELAAAAAAARVAASDAYWYAGKENIHIHGGIGFTWEADCHLYYRRARHLALLVGAPRIWKERLVNELERGTM
jgi:alkylation response protein AidB-like acyl-CoA dehydrogenase